MQISDQHQHTGQRDEHWKFGILWLHITNQRQYPE